MTDNLTMEKLVSLCKRRGFVFPGSEIYGGLANSWDYGPLGAQVRKNIKDSWWNAIVEQRADMVGFDGAIMMNSQVWKASGHTETFNDPLVECKSCHHRFRADKIEGTTCPDCGNELTKPRNFNLMFQTHIGPVEGEGNGVYLRPETAQSMFINFKNVVTASRQRVPFGMAQIGKAFRNEITPGNFIFRTLEFEQMEIEYFIEAHDWERYFVEWKTWMLQWADTIGIDTSKLHEAEVPENDLAHYSKRTIDFEFDFPFGRDELWGLAYRTDFDLTNHKLEYTDPLDPTRKYVPHVIEPTFGVDRTLLALLASVYDEEQVNNEERVVMRFKPELAPFQVAILPLSKKAELTGPALELLNNLNTTYRCDYDETQSIGKRYRRQDEIGTPYCITYDFDSVNDHQVTIRERDTMNQDRVSVADVLPYLTKKMSV